MSTFLPFNAADILKDCSDLYKERNKIYKDNYKRHGEVMLSLFPDGIELKTVEDHNRFGILTQIICKWTRYTENFNKGGHKDSTIDACTYSAMLAELDREIEQQNLESENYEEHGRQYV